ncbi:uncharacterized protein LOC121752040 isoform X1 [Salvia splendens]|uniref:uncharacterized protein LOC121752040 isoform X1 n=1 Tax=Salvia splendens TaxID=180675 RepID=UPI001C25C3D5|nr:uncharacterized protein LOC121752040 isoform X1 [Salvia splendens]
MDGARYTVTLDEFKIFHRIDRSLYVILVRDLVRNPLECLYILGLWLWLERAGFYHFVSKTLSLPPFLINELADEAVTCIKSTNTQFPFSSESIEIPLTQSLVKKDISLQFFHENHLTAFHGIEGLVRGVCIPSLSDMLEKDGYGGYVYTPMKGQIMAPSHPASAPSVSSVREPSSVENLPMQSVASVGCGDSPPSCGKGEVSRNERTMFVTFSKGYPVSEMEVRQFFSRLLGNCIESFHMQEVKREEQSLYAKIVFLRPSFIGAILKGVSKAKFTINGKHIWMRKFVPRGNKQAP